MGFTGRLAVMTLILDCYKSGVFGHNLQYISIRPFFRLPNPRKIIKAYSNLQTAMRHEQNEHVLYVQIALPFIVYQQIASWTKAQTPCVQEKPKKSTARIRPVNMHFI